MKLTVLGSGTCVPSLRRNASGYLIKAGGHQILVDCGSGTLLQLEKSGNSYKDVDAVFITHSHPDHFADLLPLLHALLYAPNFNREKDFQIFAPHAFRKYYDQAIASILGTPDRFGIVLNEVQQTMNCGPVLVRSIKTVHSADSVAYRFECDGKAIVLTGDADYDQGIIALGSGADILITDCSFPDALKVPGHMSAKECGRVAAQANAKQLILSHLYPADTPDIDRVTEAAEYFNGSIRLAEDLMVIEL